jgi:bifunctional non-homologous end joining protein LigD
MKNLIDRYREVQLATLVSKPPEGVEWLHEIKFDGYRLIAFLEGKTVKLFTRNGNDWTASFPSIRNSVAQLRARSAVLDMEAVIVEPSGRTSFNALQQALGEAGRRDGIVGYVFDLLYLDGEDLSAMTQLCRKEKLQKLLNASRVAKSIRYSEHVVGCGAEIFAKSCALGLEGIISKLAGAPYRPGRQKSWLKIKCLTRQEFIIVGFSAAKAGNRAIGALYLGYTKDGVIAYAGKVGTGFTIASAEKVYVKLITLEVKKPTASGVPRSELRYIHWVKPSLLCEVAFVEWTEDGHIRHPSFQGLREDKSARNVERETAQPVEEAVPNANSKASATVKKAAVGIVPPVFRGSPSAIRTES